MVSLHRDQVGVELNSLVVYAGCWGGRVAWGISNEAESSSLWVHGGR